YSRMLPSIITGNGVINPTAIGIVRKRVWNSDNEIVTLNLTDVYYVPTFPINIFSLQRFYEKGGRIHAFSLIDINGLNAGSFTKRFDLRTVDTPAQQTFSTTEDSSRVIDYPLWHAR